MRNKRQFVEDFILSRASADKLVLNPDGAKDYVKMGVALWEAIEKELGEVPSKSSFLRPGGDVLNFQSESN